MPIKRKQKRLRGRPRGGKFSEQLILRVPKNLRTKIKRSSRLAKHSVSNEIRLALDAWIALPEEQRDAWIEENSNMSLRGSVSQEARWALEYWVKVADAHCR